MIKLYGFGAGLGIVDPSPFVVIVIAYLKIADIPFETINSANNLQKAPRSKLPFIDDEGEIIPDSFMIIQHLKNKYQADIDQHLSEEEAAQAFLIGRSFDEDFYWQIVYSHWYEDAGWKQTKVAFFDDLPAPLKWIIPGIARRSVRDRLGKQGIALRDKQEILLLAEHALNSYSKMLTDKPYFLGESVCSLDVIAYGHLSQLILADFDCELNKLAEGYQNLIDFVHRFHTNFIDKKAS